MPKKAKKVAEEIKREHVAEIDLEGDDNPLSNQTSSQKKASNCFKCACGKSYGSLAAVHTHINNKHKEQRKKYKNLIYNPTKTGKGLSTSIRMKDIQFPQKEADLMCLADNTLKTVFDYMKGVYDSKNQKLFILEDEQNMDNDDIDSEKIQNLLDRPTSERQRLIDQKIVELREQFELNDLAEQAASYIEFRPVKIERFTLSMIEEFIKFFNVNFAAKLKLELEIIAAKKHHSLISSQNLEKCENYLWHETMEVAKLLQSYYNRWNEIWNRIQKPSPK